MNIKSNRFLSLDVFRGMTICLMIVVNSPGTGADLYPYLVHADWFGFTLADLVFPTFLFVMGNAMSFSMTKLKEAGPKAFWKKVIKRTVIIFLLGYLMYWYPFFQQGIDGTLELKPFSETRVMGVLQRIAICYFISAVIFYYVKQRGTLITAAVILLAYWALLYVFGAPGGELDMAINAGTRLDFFILGEGHIYKGDKIPFDPEGILSTLPAVVNVLAGILAGKYIQRAGKSYEGIAKLCMAGFVLAALALWWDLIFPIGKKLWTSSFVLYTVGIDLLIIAVLIYLIEIKKRTSGAEVFNIVGKNPLFIYLFSELFFITLRTIPTGSGLDAFEWVSERIFQAIFPGSFGSLVTAIAFTMLCWGVGWWLDKRRIYIKI
ncbi:acyltransferase family protein [Aestuariivivens sediminis]|uniref:acyltransferase family protein n=1 Tax=Aestuariivivens sediminis TaxID=2913557 RepID=UPI001F56EF2C|nr:acyltransferase family protein [Aestuariivivens sediminis]